MGLVELILTVCTLAQPATCKEEHLQFLDQGSLMQCLFQAPPFIAQWVDKHQGHRVVKWRCIYPNMEQTPA
jgi:hypothetical protein